MRRISAGVVALAAYLPGCRRPKHLCSPTAVAYWQQLLAKSKLPSEYAHSILTTNRFPGSVRENSWWKQQPWYDEFLARMPKQAGKSRDTFIGIDRRCCVPLDPLSVRKSMDPRPMYSSDMETIAATAVFVASRRHIRPADIDTFYCCSQTPDHELPLNGCLVHEKIGLPHTAMTTNHDQCCASFLSALEAAAVRVESGHAHNVLVTGSHCGSLIADPTTYQSTLVGDAAVAAIVSRVPDGYGFRGSCGLTHGDRHEAVIYRVGGSFLKPPGNYSKCTRDWLHLEFPDREAAKRINASTVKDCQHACLDALRSSSAAGLRVDQVDHFITHNPVMGMDKIWSDALGLDIKKCINNFRRYGNTGLCSQPINYHVALVSDSLKAGQVVLHYSPGAGEHQFAAVELVSPQLIQSIEL